MKEALRGGRCPPWSTALGGAIGIHGIEPGMNGLVRLWTSLSRVAGLHKRIGFTEGCVILSNEDVDRLWPLVRVGTPVTIHGP
jgi:hypothetical protein